MAQLELTPFLGVFGAATRKLRRRELTFAFISVQQYKAFSLLHHF